MTSDPRPIRNFRMEVSFDGTAYHGWQRQPNGITVQEVVEAKLSHLFNVERIRIQGSSRTDSGVHAQGMAVSFEAPESPYIPDWKIKKAMNRLLPPDIRIRSVDYAAPDFNARFSAKGKAYIYVVNTGDLNPFTSRWSHYQPDFTQLDAVRDAMKLLEGEHDFSAFRIRTYFKGSSFHNRHTAGGRAQVDTQNFSHDHSPFLMIKVFVSKKYTFR